MVLNFDCCFYTSFCSEFLSLAVSETLIKCLTSIVTALVKTDEDVIDLQLLFCKLQQKGEAKGVRRTKGVNVL